jgi:hypothetical protein
MLACVYRSRLIGIAVMIGVAVLCASHCAQASIIVTEYQPYSLDCIASDRIDVTDSAGVQSSSEAATSDFPRPHRMPLSQFDFLKAVVNPSTNSTSSSNSTSVGGGLPLFLATAVEENFDVEPPTWLRFDLRFRLPIPVRVKQFRPPRIL